MYNANTNHNVSINQIKKFDYSDKRFLDELAEDMFLSKEEFKAKCDAEIEQIDKEVEEIIKQFKAIHAFANDLRRMNGESEKACDF